MSRFRLYCFFFVLAALCACNSDDNVLPPLDHNLPGTPIADEQRLSILEECRGKLEELGNARKLEDKLHLLAWLLQKPGFQSAGFLPESNAVYAVFTDGRIVLFVDTPKTDEVPGGGRKSTGTDDDSRVKSSARMQELPKANKVSLFNGMGKYFGDNTLAIEKIFKASKTKYTVERKVASIENLKSATGDGVFYLYTHGGAGAIPNPPPKKDSTYVMSLWTTDAVTKVSEGAFKRELDEKKLAYMFSTFDSDKPVAHYGITGEFINAYMSFAENSIIYVDACNSNRTLATGVAFTNLVMDKAVNKRATYIGWTFETNEYMATQASQFIFDRMLGANTAGSGSTSIPKEDPLQRPFDLDRIFSDLKRRGFDVCANGATLMYNSRASDEIVVTPNIERMEVYEHSNILSIYGNFGSEKGKVTIGGKEITSILDWTPGAINCEIPETGEGSVGDVIVSVHDHPSNPVPLTAWDIKLNYATDDNGIRLEGLINLRLRADIHPTRTAPAEPPSLPEFVDYSPSSGYLFANSSNATFHIGGQKYARCNVSPCVSYFEEIPTVKSGTVPYLKLGATDPSLVSFYNWSQDRKTIKIDFLSLFLPEVTTMKIKIRYDCPEEDEETEFDGPAAMGFAVPSTEIGDIIKLEIADNYNIRAGSYSRSISRPWNPCDGSGTYKVLVTWDLIRPVSAPDDTTPARTSN